MKILVTGGAGFIGSNIVDAYVAEGHDVTVVDDLSSGKKKNVNPKAHLVLIDVRDPNISTLFGKVRFDVVNHLAAQIDVRKSVQDPFFDASANILGTLRLLDCCRTFGVKKFIFSSSGGTVYGECPDKPATEESTVRPMSPYGFSKAAAETYIRFYGTQYKLPYTILRYANVYGPRQDPSGEAGVVAIFIGKVLTKETVTIYGNGQQQRDYVYVGDVVGANVAALARGENETFNVGTGRAVSVNELYKELTETHKGSQKPVYAAARDGELGRSVLDATRAVKGLGWKPKFTLGQGLAETVRYFQQQSNKKPTKKS